MLQHEEGLTSDQLDQRIKELELREKRVRTRTVWLSILIPVISIAASYITTQQKFASDRDLVIQKFSQNSVQRILEENDLPTAKRKLEFLLAAEFLTDSASKLEDALDNYILAESTAMQEFARGFDASDSAYQYAVGANGFPQDIARAKAKYWAAMNSLTSSIELNHRFAPAWTARGTVHYQLQGYYPGNDLHHLAIADYMRALDITPEDGFIWHALGKTMHHLPNANKEEVCGCFKKAQELGHTIDYNGVDRAFSYCNRQLTSVRSPPLLPGSIPQQPAAHKLK